MSCDPVEIVVVVMLPDGTLGFIDLTRDDLARATEVIAEERRALLAMLN